MAKKYYLGLDLGISSVGWAVMCEENDEYYIDDFGVRLFDVAEDPKEGTTNAEQRRTLRGARRLNRRRKQRIKELKAFLEGNNITTSKQLEDYYLTKKATNLITYDENIYFNPYVLRVKGLNEKLSGQELGVVLLHIANSRGYNDKFSFNEEDKKKKTKLTTALTKTENLVAKQTIAEAIINEQDFKSKQNASLIAVRNRVAKAQKLADNLEEKSKDAEGYRFLFAREDYRKELYAILQKQQEYYQQLEDKLETVIDNIILRQRDFEEGPGPKDKLQFEKWQNYMNTAKRMKQKFYPSFLDLKSNCIFYPKEIRGFMCSLVFDFFHLVVELSKFTARLSEQENKQIALAVFAYIVNDEKIDKNHIKKLIEETIAIKFNSKDNAWENIKLNLEYIKLLKTTFDNSLISKIDYDNLEKNIFHDLGEILHTKITPKRREEEIIKFLSANQLELTREQINKFLAYKKTKTSNVSFKYMQEAINAFLNGIPYGNFQDEFNKKRQKAEENYLVDGSPTQTKKLFAPIIDKDLWRNASVFRAVNQTRKVLQALHQRYQKFAVINVEVANELAKSFEDRKEIKKRNDTSYKNRLEIETKLESAGINVNSTNILKYQLWQSQLGYCIYSKEKITLEMLTNTSLLQVDHIIPQSKFADDSFDNKVLVFTKENQDKKKQLPLDWLKNNPEKLKTFKNFCKFLKTENKISKKKYEYLMVETLDDETLNAFASRNLNDTRYITRYVVSWLKSEFIRWENQTGEILSTVVQSINGKVTSRFRRSWLRSSPWGLDEKVREITPFHHAIDAIILTQFTSFSYVTFASDIANICSLKQRLNSSHDKLSLDAYYEACNEILVKWQHASSRPAQYQDKAKWTSKVNLYVPNAVVSLQNIINDINRNVFSFSPLIKNLKDVIELRIPVKLISEKVKIPYKVKDQEDVIKEKWVPKYKTVLNKEEYFAILNSKENIKGNIHYPFISYKIDRRLGGNYFSSQNIVSKLKLGKKVEQIGDKEFKTLNSDQKSKLKHIATVAIQEHNIPEGYHLDKNKNIWETNSYYGVVMNYENDKLKPIWIRRIDAKEALKKHAIKDMIIHNDIIEYYDKKTQKKKIKIFKGKKGDQISACLVATIYTKSNEIFGEQNSYDSLSNWKEFKKLKIDFLGTQINKN